MQCLREIHDAKDSASRQMGQDKVGDWNNEPSYPGPCSTHDSFGQAMHLITTSASRAGPTNGAAWANRPRFVGHRAGCGQQYSSGNSDEEWHQIVEGPSFKFTTAA